MLSTIGSELLVQLASLGPGCGDLSLHDALTGLARPEETGGITVGVRGGHVNLLAPVCDFRAPTL